MAHVVMRTADIPTGTKKLSQREEDTLIVNQPHLLTLHMGGDESASDVPRVLVEYLVESSYTSSYQLRDRQSNLNERRQDKTRHKCSPPRTRTTK